MRFEQVSVLLDHTRAFHRRLAEHYDRLRGEVERQRTQMLLEYVVHLERTLEQGLADFEAQGPRIVLDTWLDFAADEQFMNRLEHLGSATEIALDDVVPEVLELHSSVVDAYGRFDQDALPPEVAAVLEDVVALEKQRGKQLARAAGQLQDL